LRYWDASALIPLLVQEPGTALARGWLEEDRAIVTWAWSLFEIRSAIERRVREGLIARARRQPLLDQFGRLARDWEEVVELSSVRARALALLARHPLRAADAAQLGAALLVAEDDPTSLTLVTLDRRLAEAAEREGLRVLSWPLEEPGVP
jgi:uncharacterized protein